MLALAGALALPAPALAVDHVSLYVSPSALAAGTGWRLSASVPAREFQRGGELLGLTLRRRFLSGRAEEMHALRAALSGVTTVTFNGRRGRWNVRNYVGPVLSVNMQIVATGVALPLRDYRGCTGAFVEVPVALNGMFVLRTQTAFFGTIRRARLRGVVIFNQGGPAGCPSTAPLGCAPFTSLNAWNAAATQSLHASPNGGGVLGISFRQTAGSTPIANPDWYHVMTVSQFAPLSGQLPTLAVRIPPSLPITGSGIFTAGETLESPPGSCSMTTVRGTFAGTFRTRFAGWGVRSLTAEVDQAAYVESR